ncbi:hypothetical protein FA95DRAFT_543256 [Auriscalpium vulgare]|uniref:Uncharacterized protein n=1 Tax=Auriscalpium vulgare TaxID=40419 RepID=A0ACB8RG73_9AGAM|nr:hypothetical protein FA95DRAFT_543256 [Auriscalpium vulgare]
MQAIVSSSPLRNRAHLRLSTCTIIPMGNTRSRPYIYSPLEKHSSTDKLLKDDSLLKQWASPTSKDSPSLRDESSTTAAAKLALEATRRKKAPISRAESHAIVERKRHQLCVVRDDAALLSLANKHSDLSAVDPAVLAPALFHAIGLHIHCHTDWCPPADFVIYLEFTEDRARHNPERALPAESLPAAAHHFLARRAVEKSIEAPYQHLRVPGLDMRHPVDLVSSSISDRDRRGDYRPLYDLVIVDANLSNADPSKLASALYRALDLPRGQQPSPEYVILFEFIDGQRYRIHDDPEWEEWEEFTLPASSLVGAAYYFLLKLAAKRDEKRWWKKRRHPHDATSFTGAGRISGLGPDPSRHAGTGSIHCNRNVVCPPTYCTG